MADLAEQASEETRGRSFFSEEQFEVYRALGFHTANGFFNGHDRFGRFLAAEHDGWLEQLEAVLKHLNVPQHAIGKILERARMDPAGKSGGLEQAPRATAASLP